MGGERLLGRVPDGGHGLPRLRWWRGAGTTRWRPRQWRIANAYAFLLLEPMGCEGDGNHCRRKAKANMLPKLPHIVGLSLILIGCASPSYDSRDYDRSRNLVGL
jgi:hypothetical protein